MNGERWCWGKSSDGELGNGSTTSQQYPVQANAVGGGVTNVAAAYNFTCALKTDGNVLCWGSNWTGGLGNGSTVGSSEPSPNAVLNLGSGVEELVAGGTHVCARKSTGAVYCWGGNRYGEVGDGTTTGQGCGGMVCKPSPTLATAIGSDVAQVSAGSTHTCVRRTDGSVWCWGENSRGQLGDGTLTGQACNASVCKPTPVQVTELGNQVKWVTAGAGHTCALKLDGSVWCWGMSSTGQLGDGQTSGQSCGGSYTCRPNPILVTGLGNQVQQVVASGAATCAILANGTLWCWGLDEYGQLGDGPSFTQMCGSFECSPSPVQVTGINAAVRVALAVGGHACAAADGTLWCWGKNGNRQLGDGSTMNSPSPVAVVLPCP